MEGEKERTALQRKGLYPGVGRAFNKNLSRWQKLRSRRRMELAGGVLGLLECISRILERSN